MQFDVQEAKAQFSKLVAAIERGETVTICRDGKPVIECVPAKTAKPFPFGKWGKPRKSHGDGSHLVKPTPDDLLDEMGL